MIHSLFCAAGGYLVLAFLPMRYRSRSRNDDHAQRAAGECPGEFPGERVGVAVDARG